jgi:hypothetical protein
MAVAAGESASTALQKLRVGGVVDQAHAVHRLRHQIHHVPPGGSGYRDDAAGPREAAFEPENARGMQHAFGVVVKQTAEIVNGDHVRAPQHQRNAVEGNVGEIHAQISQQLREPEMIGPRRIAPSVGFDLKIGGQRRHLPQVFGGANQMELVRRILRRHGLQKVANIRADAEIANSPDVKRYDHVFGLSRLYQRSPPAVERESGGEIFNALAHIGNGFLGIYIPEDVRDAARHFLHFPFAEAAGSDGRTAQPDAARVHRRVGIERDGVLVDRDARGVERILRLSAFHAFGEHVDAGANACRCRRKPRGNLPRAFPWKAPSRWRSPAPGIP